MTTRALTRDLPPVLGKLIPLLSSPFDAERLATVAAIDRALKAANRDWHDVASATTAQAPPTQWSYEPQHRTESGAAQQMRAWLTAVAREDWPNAWTAGFVADLLRRPSLGNSHLDIIRH